MRAIYVDCDGTLDCGYGDLFETACAAADIEAGDFDADPTTLATAYVDAEVDASTPAEGTHRALNAFDEAATQLGVLTRRRSRPASEARIDRPVRAVRRVPPELWGWRPQTRCNHLFGGPRATRR